MKDILCNSIYFGVLISIACYELGTILNKKFRLPFFNPLLISISMIIILLLVLKVDYESYYTGAKYLSYLLTPATVCLAIPLYEQLELLKINLKAIMAAYYPV
jgi:putative effector of murein hydrolase